MIPYQREKIENAVCFFATKHRSKTKHPLYQTFLYKYLAFFDFGYLRRYGKPALGLTYRAMKRGPVPVELYDNRDDSGIFTCFSFQKDENDYYLVIPKGAPDLDYFSGREIDMMERLVEIFGKEYVSSKVMSDASHEDILAWRRTWQREQNAIIDFSLEFPDDVFDKKEHQLTFPEEVFLVRQGIESCG